MAENTPKSPKKPAKTDRHGRKMPRVASRDLPMKRFIENVPDNEFSAALESSPDPKFATFLAARADPAYATLSFSALCRKFNISLQDVDDLWRNHQLHRGMIQMMTHVPQVLEDVAQDAKSKMVVCTRCDGEGVLVSNNGPDDTGGARVCPVCDGAKKIKVSGDKAARDLVFESIGLTGKRSPMVAIQQNFGLDSGLEDILISTQRVLSGGTDK